MKYEERLIGSWKDIEIPKDENGELIEDSIKLEEIVITQENILDPHTLQKEYGWAGESFGTIIGNSAINKLLLNSDVTSIRITSDTVHGLESLHDGDQAVIQTLLHNQTKPVQRIFYAAKTNELDEFDDISSGAIKGILAGAGVGISLDAAGFSGLGGELMSRAGPGMLEASGIAQEVLGKENTGVMKRATDSLEEIAKNSAGVKKVAAKGASYVTGLLQDFKNIGLRVIPNVYSVAKNIVKCIALPLTYPIKLAGFDINTKLGDAIQSTSVGRYLNGTPQEVTSTTAQWALGQEKAPYWGLAGLAVVKTLNDYSRLTNLPGAHIAFTVLESIFVFTINTGNNVAGTYSVYQSHRQKGMNRLEALKETYKDPFQIANTAVCGIWYAGEFTMRSMGFRPEEQLGQTGAGLESAVLSMDTAVAGQIAKKVARYQLMSPAKKAIRHKNLKALCKEHGASETLVAYVEEHKPIENIPQRMLNGIKAIAPYITLPM